MYACSLLAVGDELLDGRVKDTNSDFIAESLGPLGMEIVLRVIIGDDAGRIGGALELALEHSDLIIITGGLGPTGDDLTREAVAETLGLPLCRDAELESRLGKFFEAMGREMSPTNLKQADLLEGATPITARLGTAPGQWVEKGGKIVVLVPGVPVEMRDMVEGDVIPMLLERFALKEEGETSTLLVAARPESELAEEVERALSGLQGMGVSYRAMMGQIEIKLTARSTGVRLEDAVRRIKESLGPWVVAEGKATLEGVLGNELRSRGLSLAVAESLTGGMVGERITGVPGSSGYFRGGVIAYSYEAKEKLLGVDASLLRSRGAANEDAAMAMAVGVRKRFAADVGIALSGVAGPGSGGEKEPPGTVAFGLADAQGTHGWKYRLPGDRGMVRQFASTIMLTIALFYARGEDISHVR